jgi:hypothetical protein
MFWEWEKGCGWAEPIHEDLTEVVEIVLQRREGEPTGWIRYHAR